MERGSNDSFQCEGTILIAAKKHSNPGSSTRRLQPRIRSVMTMPTMICAVASSQIDISSYSAEPGRRCGAIMCVPIHIGLLSWLRGAHKAEQ
jgi:hypothetical protein